MEVGNQCPVVSCSAGGSKWQQNRKVVNQEERGLQLDSGLKVLFVLSTLLAGMCPLSGVADDFQNLLKDEEIDVPSNKIGFLSVTCSTNGEYYGGANGIKRLVIRRVDDGSVVKDIKSKRVGIQSFEFDPSSNNIAIGYTDGMLSVESLNGESKEIYADLPLRGITDIEYSSDGKYVVAAGHSKVIVLNAKDLSEIYTVSDMSTHLAIRINKDNSILAVGKTRGLTLLNFKDGSEIQHLGNSGVFSIDFSSDGRLLAFDYIRHGVIWSLTEDKLDHSVINSVLTRIAINTDGSTMLIGGVDGVVRQIDLRSQTEINHITVPGGSIRSMETCGGKYLITGHSYDIMNVLDLLSGRIVRTHQGK
jgi:WD40 repeat protein